MSRHSAKSSYSGELLTPEAMPAPEFLSALQHTFTSGASPWLPWRSRCTEADRRPRSDRQLLRTLFEAEEEMPGPTAFVPPAVSALSLAVLSPQAARKPKLQLRPPRRIRYLLPRLLSNPGTRRSTGSRRA